MLKVLIDNNPNAMNIDKIGHYTIWTAACNAKIEVLKYLKERLNWDFFEEVLIERDSFNQTIFHRLAKEGHFEIVKLLASYTPNPNVADMNGWTPAQYAIQNGFFDIAAFFLELETKQNSKKNFMFKLAQKMFRR